ncbi:ras association domain-containing protein 10-like [Ischnura elegans]|uniref:ras association domain-containing protein 10-like n=1 Tax=Ischnura elegans TaxID=197161 RepID=UPI001ED8B60F|nr:ras association domain-containing protein 10-like [Ischnura elegans]
MGLGVVAARSRAVVPGDVGCALNAGSGMAGCRGAAAAMEGPRLDGEGEVRDCFGGESGGRGQSKAAVVASTRMQGVPTATVALTGAATAEVPVWVNGLQRWVTGIDRRTTCDDVIRVLLKSEPQTHQQRHHSPGRGGWAPQHQNPEELHHRYAIVERWRKVERPLDGRSRILKVWSAWGDAQRDVKLALRRRVPGDIGPSSGGTSAPMSSALTKEGSRRRRHHHHHLVGRESSAKTIHPRRLYSRACRGEEAEDGRWEGVLGAEGGLGEEWAEGEDGERPQRSNGEQRKFTETMEKLMKLILAQGETIQAQLKKLREREDQIDHFEHEVHRLRVKNHGSNYLLDTYLKGVDAEIGLGEDGAEEDEDDPAEEDKEGSGGGEDSGVVTEGGSGDGGDPSPPRGTPKERPPDEEKRPRDGGGGAEPEQAAALEDLQPQIEAWEKILKVNKKLEKTEECLVKLHAKLRQHEAVAAVRMREEEDRELEWTRAEVERVTLQSQDVELELRRNEQALANADEWLRVRHEVLDGLQQELEAAERESELLSRRKAEEEEALRYGNSVRIGDVATYGMTRRVTFLPNPVVECCGDKVGIQVRKVTADKDPHDTDSNSDTGLSSLHSSSEEGGYVLDTLV